MTLNPFDLSGQVAVITGSSRGIGRASAELLAQLGAKVVISSRKADACEEARPASAPMAVTPMSSPATSRAALRSTR